MKARDSVARSNGSASLPRALLLDLDDTILDDSRNISSCWRDACFAHAPALGETDPGLVFEEIERTRDWYWGDPERHRLGRLRLADARRDVVRMSIEKLGLDCPGVADSIAAHYQSARDRGIAPLEGAIETVRWLRDRGCRLALLTNGDGRVQRSKIDRFSLGPLFDEILIEGELGYGKPDPRVLTGVGVRGLSLFDGRIAAAVQRKRQRNHREFVGMLEAELGKQMVKVPAMMASIVK